MHCAILGLSCAAMVAAIPIDVCRNESCALRSHFKKSAVVVLERREQPATDVGDMKAFKTVVRALFEQRRKMSRKALKVLDCDVHQLLDAADIDGTRRGETLNLDEIARISRQFQQMRERS